MADRGGPPESTPNVAYRLRLTREALGLNKATWCRLVGITPQAWANIEGTSNTPAINRISLPEALKVCRAIGVGLDWIYQGDQADLPQKIALDIRRLESGARKGRPA